ncbi:MAG: glycoside hydrolase, partial [Actinomycetota bacterium]|nr:glycoside hydrolase [Actinomycetota bacterium]
MWRWVRVALAAAAAILLLLALWTPEPRHGPPTVGRAVETDGAGTGRPLVRSHEAPDLLVDRQNSRLIYLSGVDLATGACTLSVSLDGGVTWRAENTPHLQPYSSNCGLGTVHPRNVRTELDQGPDGTLYYVFQGNDPDAGGTRSVLLGRSDDRGRTWSTVVVDPGPKATSPEQAQLNFQGHVAIDPDDPRLVYVMWRRSVPVVDPTIPSTLNRPYLAVSRDGGATFGPPTLLLD